MIYLDSKMERVVDLICLDLFGPDKLEGRESRQALLCMRDKLKNTRHAWYRKKIIKCATDYPTREVNEFVNYIFKFILNDIDD